MSSAPPVRRMAVLQIDLQVLAGLLQLPEGTVIHAAMVPIEYAGSVLRLQVEHPDLPVAEHRRGNILQTIGARYETINISVFKSFE